MFNLVRTHKNERHHMTMVACRLRRKTFDFLSQLVLLGNKYSHQKIAKCDVVIFPQSVKVQVEVATHSPPSVNEMSWSSICRGSGHDDRNESQLLVLYLDGRVTSKALGYAGHLRKLGSTDRWRFSWMSR
jgi:hypothetical protein